MNAKFFTLGILICAGAQPVAGCDLCSVYSASEAQGGRNGGFFGGLAEQLTYFNTLQVDGHEVPNDGEYIYSSVSQLFAGYNINSRFSVQANVPIIHKSWGSSGGGNHSETGIGDVSLLGNARLYEKLTEHCTFTWTALAGLKLPTGNPHHLDPHEADFAAGIGGHDLTLGSGSVDGIIGSGVMGRWKRVFATASVQYALRSSGAFDYRFANDLSWSGGPGVYLALNHKYTFSLQAVCSGETKGQDVAQGVQTIDTAETLVYVGPEAHFTWGSRVSALVGVDVPLLINNSDEQLMPDWRLRAAVSVRF